VALSARRNLRLHTTANYNGTDSFTYQAHRTVRRSAHSPTVTITVTAVNDAPVAGDDTAGTTEDNSVSGTC